MGKQKKAVNIEPNEYLILFCLNVIRNSITHQVFAKRGIKKLGYQVQNVKNLKEATIKI